MILGNLIKFSGKMYDEISIKGISFDSRKIKKNDIFFAINGSKESGNKYIKEAIDKGASAIICDKKNKYKNFKIPIIKVSNVRKSLTVACSKFYNKKPKNIIAITGTNGKSSVADFYYQILKQHKILAASIGTLGIHSKNYNKKTNLTSLDPLLLHKTLQILKNQKIDNVILEASSHGLDQKRLDNLSISAAIFTNLSHDHLDYHKNMKNYLNSKMYLFKELIKEKSKIITDEENDEFKIIKKISYKKKLKKFTIGTSSGTIQIKNNTYYKNKQIIKLLLNNKIFTLEIPLIGYFQIKNLLMAAIAASFCGLNIYKILKKLNKIKAVPGRLECVEQLYSNYIILDFAHTPEALEQSLIALKKQFKSEITIVFGCGGERDKKKRFSMGKIAKKYCRKIFVTDDNPRNEDPKKIRQHIIKGCKDIAENIGDRREAIKSGIMQLRKNEILLVAGKGHETKQIYKNKVINFSDKKIIKEIINKNKIYLKKNEPLLKNIFKNNKINNFTYNGVSINSKKIKKNNLFFAIKGAKTDGHKFVKEAIKNGATKSIVSKKIFNVSKKKIIKVKNTLHTLNELALSIRNNSSAKIIGITGSVGKTTLKNLVNFSLKNYGQVHCSPKSYNNKFGVPYSVSNLKINSKFGVFEIGMDKRGEINFLSKIVKPEIGIITNIGEAHLKNFKSIKDIAKAKSEIIDNILDDGAIILNKDDKFFNFLSSKAKKRNLGIISFSSKNKADICLINIKKNKNIFRMKIKVKNEFFYFDIKNQNESLIKNILACISILSHLDLNLNIMKNKFKNFIIPSGRGDIKIVKKFDKKFYFIDESYNANPLSMKSAIKNISFYKRKKECKKLIFLGDMLELGEKSRKLHKKLSTTINNSDIDKVYIYGKYIKETFNFLSKNKKGKIFNNLNEAYKHFGKILNNNDLLLVKGSHATGLNKFSQKFKKGSVSVI